MNTFKTLIIISLILFTASTSWGLTRAERIALGGQLFMNETFNGNGRTCASCHPVESNTQLGVQDIAALSPYNAVFTNVLNDLPMFASHALVLTHHDGFNEPATFRTIPDLFGAYRRNAFGRQLLQRDPTAEVFKTRVIIRNAVKDHMSQSLNREPGADYRFPTARELNLLVQYINSLRPVNTQ